MNELKNCPHCKGTGKVLNDDYVGQTIRNTRRDKGVTLRELARRCGWSAAYLSDLELGRRRWDSDKQKRVVEALRRQNGQK